MDPLISMWKTKALAAVSQNGTSLRHCAEPLRDDQAGAEW